MVSISPREMFKWKKPENFGPTTLGVANIILCILAAATAQFSKAISTSTLVFGIVFFCIGLINSKSKPTVLASIFTALLGLTWFLTVMGIIDTILMAVLSFLLFILVLAFELGLKFGPLNTKAKSLLLIPMFCLGATLILAFPGLNQLIKVPVFWTTRLSQNPFTTTITLNYIIVLASYITTILFCWLYIFNYVGWKLFKTKTYLWMNLLVIAAIALSFIAWIQGMGIVTW